MKLRNLWLYTRVFSGFLAILLLVGLSIAALVMVITDSLLPAVILAALILLVLALGGSSIKWTRKFGAGALALRKGQFPEAEQHLIGARALAERFGEHDPRRPIGQHLLGEIYLAQARYDEAEEQTRQALALRERIWGPDDAQVMHSYVGLANIYMAMARFAEAEELLLRALRVTESTCGPYHPGTGACVNNLGKVYGDQRRHAKAEEYYRRSLAIFEKWRNRENIGIALSNIAFVCVCQGKADEAEPLARRAQALLEKALPPGHPYRTYPLNTLARVMNLRKDFAEGEEIARRVLTIREQALGPEHPLVAHALETLAQICKDQGKLDETEVLYRRALAIRSATGVPHHPDVVENVQNYANLLHLRGRSAEAEALLQAHENSRQAPLRPVGSGDEVS